MLDEDKAFSVCLSLLMSKWDCSRACNLTSSCLMLSWGLCRLNSADPSSSSSSLNICMIRSFLWSLALFSVNSMSFGAFWRTLLVFSINCYAFSSRLTFRLFSLYILLGFAKGSSSSTGESPALGLFSIRLGVDSSSFECADSLLRSS